MTAGFDVAHEVFSGSGADDLISPEQRKMLDAAVKKKREEETAAWNTANKRTASPYLSMALAGGKRIKKDRTNSPCHLCQ